MIQAFKQLKEDRRKAIEEMRRQMFEKGQTMKVDRPPEISKDPGLLDSTNSQYEEFFKMMDSTNEVRIATLLRIQDSLYNQFRKHFKECSTYTIRPHFRNPS